MFCPNCGTENDNNAQFCLNCGNQFPSSRLKINLATKRETAYEQPQNYFGYDYPPQSPKQPKPKKGYDGKRHIALPIVCLLVCLSVLLGSVVMLHVEVSAYDAYTSAEPNKQKDANTSYDLNAILRDVLNGSIPASSLTSEEAAAIEAEISTLEDNLDEAEAELASEYDTVTAENLTSYIYSLSSYARQWYDDGIIESFDYSSSCIRVKLSTGGNYIIAPAMEEYDAGSEDEGDFELKIATYQPCYDSYDSSLSDMMKYVDRAAETIDGEFDQYIFSSSANLDDRDVTPEAVLDFSEYHVILWHGHGSYDDSFGSLLVSGIPRSRDNDIRYHDLIDSGALLYSADSYYFSYLFFENYLPDGALDNAIVYLGTCCSGKSSTLANSLLNKGAAAVYANSDIIHTVYNLKMIKSVAEGLCKKNADGAYYSVAEALEYAKDQNGRYDYGQTDDTYVRLFTNDDSFNLEWYTNHISSDRSIVLVLDNSGSMSGTPMEETKEAAVNFVNTVLDYQAAVGLVHFNYSAHMDCGFTLNRTKLVNSINDMSAGGNTNLYDGLSMAKSMLDETDSEKKIIILMSDGLPNAGFTGDTLVSYAGEIKDDGVYIYTLGFFTDLWGSEKSEAQALMNEIATEGYHYEIGEEDDIVFFFDDIANQVSGLRYIYIRIACPVDVKISYDGETLNSNSKKRNTRTSFGSLSFENADGDTEEGDEEDLVKIVRLIDGVNYDVEISGTGRGKMNYSISYVDENGNYTDTREFRRIAITKNTEITTSTAQAEKILLSVDEDGDGKVDIEYAAEENGRGEEISHTTEHILVAVIVASSIGLLASLIFLLLRLRKYRVWKRSVGAGSIA